MAASEWAQKAAEGWEAASLLRATCARPSPTVELRIHPGASRPWASRPLARLRPAVFRLGLWHVAQ